MSNRQRRNHMTEQAKDPGRINISEERRTNMKEEINVQMEFKNEVGSGAIHSTGDRTMKGRIDGERDEAVIKLAPEIFPYLELYAKYHGQTVSELVSELVESKLDEVCYMLSEGSGSQVCSDLTPGTAEKAANLAARILECCNRPFVGDEKVQPTSPNGTEVKLSSRMQECLSLCDQYFREVKREKGGLDSEMTVSEVVNGILFADQRRKAKNLSKSSRYRRRLNRVVPGMADRILMLAGLVPEQEVEEPVEMVGLELIKPYADALKALAEYSECTPQEFLHGFIYAEFTRMAECYCLDEDLALDVAFIAEDLEDFSEGMRSWREYY
jgi:hypothetical protein